jgi:hypothetical protein
MWPVNRGCLLLHGTWSHLWYIQSSVYVHSLICISYETYEIDYWSLFFSFHTTIPHNKLKFKLFQIIDNFKKNDTRKYKFLVIGKQDTHFVRYQCGSPYKYSEADIKSMLCFLVDNIYVALGDQVFQQYVGIAMGTNWAPLLADLFLYSCETNFVQKMLQDNQKKKKKKN